MAIVQVCPVSGPPGSTPCGTFLTLKVSKRRSAKGSKRVFFAISTNDRPWHNPDLRLTCETDTPRTRVCAQIFRFSSSLQFRRLIRLATKRSDNAHLLTNGHYLSRPVKGRAGLPGAYHINRQRGDFCLLLPQALPGRKKTQAFPPKPLILLVGARGLEPRTR
jgi:hypothetical protein